MQVPEGTPADRGSIVSSDGVVLGYVRLGAGPPLVVCHGAFATSQDWLAFATHLAPRRTVYVYDRRGRGSSPYSRASQAVDAEVDDLSAMVDLAGPDAAVVGHSFGGGCALSFAARGGFPGPLIVYEPRHSTRALVSRGQIPEIERLLAIGDLDAVTEFVLTSVVGMPAQAIAGIRHTPFWDAMARTMNAFPNESRFLDSLTWGPGDLDRISGPVTLLVGQNSPVLPDDLSPDAALRSLLPQLRTVIIPGQGHLAYMTAPALLAQIVLEAL